MFDVHAGSIVGIDVLAPGNEFTVSARTDGEVQVWNMDTAKLVASLPICYEVAISILFKKINADIKSHSLSFCT